MLFICLFICLFIIKQDETVYDKVKGKKLRGSTVNHSHTSTNFFSNKNKNNDSKFNDSNNSNSTFMNLNNTNNINIIINPNSTSSTNISQISKKSKITKNNEKVINNMYLPYMEKKFYNIALNSGVSHIKQNTRKNSMDNFKLAKRKTEINKIVDGLLIYNNPSIILI